jgi:light-regulated signal transduction histidine kinase (bacteriophytochrome)
MSLTSRKKMARLRQELLRKAREKEQFEAALNEKFEEVKADNGMQVGKLENKLEQEKAKTEEAHRLLRESVKLVAHMTSLLKGQGGSVH